MALYPMKKLWAKPISYSNADRDKKAVQYIVIHYTGNRNDTAENNAKYYANTNTREAGAHFFIDQNGKIFRSVPMNRAAWAVGGSKYNDCGQTGGGTLYNICTNYNSVSIELCDLVDKNPSPKMVGAVKRTIKYIRKHCPNALTVIRHFDVTGKHCPASMMNNDIWTFFKRVIGE